MNIDLNLIIDSTLPLLCGVVVCCLIIFVCVRKVQWDKMSLEECQQKKIHDEQWRLAHPVLNAIRVLFWIVLLVLPLVNVLVQMLITKGR